MPRRAYLTPQQAPEPNVPGPVIGPRDSESRLLRELLLRKREFERLMEEVDTQPSADNWYDFAVRRCIYVSTARPRVAATRREALLEALAAVFAALESLDAAVPTNGC